ncbi:sodium:proton antiporter [Sedimentibacter hydroxybenzoicus DSM 7310]|uniref:Sodium:proton antiporter n=1 Tax=Sedimentibacter hydroxybenzoicus DSM 7310 TaxID=1123245 RepID=A0A974BMT0_SEDHY|nr:Na+/H+ antiporter NhaC family protein [Sedimentibacter hydroxybenzoicus]NYB75838.1 sodium:proton antiporter [Sedimentibacter hydroxybenzoicus DSM 7310]
METKKLALNNISLMIICLGFIIGSIIMSIPLYYGFLAGIVLTVAVLVKNGYGLNDLVKTIFTAVYEIKNLIIVILFIGATTSIWMASGVVPTIMYYGFSYMEGVNFLFAAFLIMVTVSLFMGTAIGTMSTVGISLSGIGMGLGIPQSVVVGMLVSGAFIADKISPLSGLINLLMTTTGKSYKDIFKTMIVTLIPTIIIAAAVYYIIGLSYTTGDYDKLILYREAIAEGFNTSPYLLILPVIILGLSIAGLNSIITFSIGVGVGSVLSILFQGSNIKTIIMSILFGYKGNTPSAELNKLLVSGGMVSMIEAILMVIGAIVLVQLFEKGNILLPIMEKLVNGINTKVTLVRRTGLLSTLLTVATCDQTAGIILPTKILKNKYEELDLDLAVLTRTISDTGIIVAPLMPWNINSFLIKPIMGITAAQYAPFAVLCFICPVVSVTMSYMLYRKK